LQVGIHQSIVFVLLLPKQPAKWPTTIERFTPD
jgi:hypothetical protein